MSTFLGTPAILERSVFTYRGPIVKPPLVLDSGVNATLLSPTTLTVAGEAFTSSLVGANLTLSGGGPNDGTYPIVKVIDAETLTLLASWSTPDSFSYGWEISVPRNGELADSTADVTVRVNGVPVNPTAVDGLLGQIVLPSVPLPTDTVEVDYRYIPFATYGVQRLNHPGLTLNAGRVRGNRKVDPKRQRSYPYAAVLPNPAANGINPSSLASLAQPIRRHLHYRAIERRYTATLNDSHLFRLNAPTSRIAYPPSSRRTDPDSVAYEATVLPEADARPWVRVGTGGAASVAGGRLTLQDTLTGFFPSSSPLFFTRQTDLTFPHAFAMAWRFQILASPSMEGVWTGLSVGWAGNGKVFLLGYLKDGSTWKVGVLGSSNPNSPKDLSSWQGVVDLDPTYQRTYRVVRSPQGLYQVFFDGNLTPAITVLDSSLPSLNDLTGPFDKIQSVFFGSLSYPSSSTSIWEFVRYESLPSVFSETLRSSYVTYEANQVPSLSTPPWLSIGYHGEEAVEGGDTLILKSTAATDLTPSGGDTVTGAYRGFLRLEPLLSSSVDTVLDFEVAGREFTHGPSPYGLFSSVFDGRRLAQVCMVAPVASPKKSYPGDSLPEDASPDPFLRLGGGVDPSQLSVTMEGKTLRISDQSAVDGVIYSVEDAAAFGSPQRILEPLVDFRAECKLRVTSYVADGSGFAGVSFDVFDGHPLSLGRPVGMMLRVVAGTPHVALHTDGSVLSSVAFPWDDGAYHTYKVVKDLNGDLVSLFVDDALLTTTGYSAIPTVAGNGTFSFGSSTPLSVASQSDVHWMYANVWRKNTSSFFNHLYVGLWKGTVGSGLLDFYFPLWTHGEGKVVGNTLQDDTKDFFSLGVSAGDFVLIDDGPNRGAYEINNLSPTSLIFGPPSPFPLLNASVTYRVIKASDWSTPERYRLIRDPAGGISLFQGTSSVPLLTLSYDQLPLGSGKSGVASGGIPCVAFGSWDPEELCTSAWSYLRYAAKAKPDATKAVNKMFRLNQRNIMASPEHLLTPIPHAHTNYWSSSTGIPPQGGDPTTDLHRNEALDAFTQLNEGTPLVPQTQTWENRKVPPTFVPSGGINNPSSLLNTPGFFLNDTSGKIQVVVPQDVLYNCLEVIERVEGDEEGLISPAQDVTGGVVSLGTLSFTKEVCLSYTADTLPQDDPSAGTPWVLAADNPGLVVTSLSGGGALTFGTLGVTRAAYYNNTPLPDVMSHPLTVRWRVKVVDDPSLGLGDTEVRLGLSAPGMTMALALVTVYTGERQVQVKDMTSNVVVAAIPFDFLDGAYHVYQIKRTPGNPPSLSFEIDP